MSDDFDDDSFLVDDSFLAELDNITASATSKTTQQSTFNRTTSLPVNRPSAQPAISGRTQSVGTPSGFSTARNAFASSSKSTSTSSAAAERRRAAIAEASRPVAGPSKLSRPPSRPLVHPSSDDFGDIDLPTGSLDFLDTIAAKPATSSGRAQSIPSSRLGLGRSLARQSSGSDGFQTHLNFRRDKQSTKGKRWDRTAFAESGRRVDAAKIKASKMNGRGFDDDEELEQEDDDMGEPLAPPPKPLVDISSNYGPPKHLLDPETKGTYIYPTNRSKRDYQYEIVRGCFTDNCLVALPTGLGKTFVAGVVMLNFYRWFPTGKIVFLAPTKPLVNQQIEACQLTCGIPSKDAAVMTGSSVSQKDRARMWRERRVFYCTPQTLDNDLKKGSVDPKDIVLAVFDEAHKASGSYAYTTILAYITAHHPYFRVLALTATPGADVPRVQAVVDALHISRIEIREAEAPEIKKYMNEKKTEKHSVPMGSVIDEFSNRWADIMRPFVQKLVSKDILTDRDLDIKRLKPFRMTAKRMEITRDRNSTLKWCYGSLSQIEKMARAMGHLLEFSLGMFHTGLTEIAGGQNEAGKKSGPKAGASGIRNNFEFQKLLRDVEAEMNMIRINKDGRTKADRHPKMVKTLQLLLDHFQLADEDEKIHGVKNDTRAMVFCSFRDCVLEVVDMLNQHPELLRATKFVGQSQGKQEIDKGFNQKEQKKTIQEFKEGKHNILVSTSIGEEGLDIGEVDFVVIYDMPKQSIKLLQRIGRTGRKRDGKVHVLMSEGREDMNWDSAQQTHREIQEEILHSRNLELFEDVEPLLIPGQFPKCVEQEMPVDPWDPADQKSKTRLPGSQSVETGSKTTKKPRGHEIPDDAPDGFMSVAALLKGKGKGKKRARSPTPIQSDHDDDDDHDSEAENDLLYGTIKPSKPMTAKAAKAVAQAKGKAKGLAKKAEAIEKKYGAKRAKAAATKETKEEKQKRLEEEKIRKEEEQRTQKAIDFFNTHGPLRRRGTSPPATPPSSSQSEAGPSERVPARLKPKRSGLPPSPISDESLPKAGPSTTNVISPRTAALAGFSQLDTIDLSWDDDDFDDDIEMVQPEAGPSRLSKPPLGHSRSTAMMPPPPIPSTSRPSVSPADSRVVDSPFNIRPGAQSRPARPLSTSPVAHLVAPSTGSPAPRQATRNTLFDDHSPLVPQPRRQRQTREPRRQRVSKETVKNLFELDVGVSGSEQSADESSGEESESDRRFANDFQPTQAPAGYDQRAVYAAGLSTQAPSKGLNFRSAQVANARKEGFFAKARKPVLLTDSEGEGSGEENEYQLGSFVCDDESVGFDTQTHSDPLSCT